MNLITRIIVLSLLILLVGCSYLPTTTLVPNRDKQYLAAKSIPPLKIPPGIASSAFHSTYPVSGRQYSVSAEDISLVPPDLMSNK
jgi:uncharacterized lipoprotein